MPPASLSLAAAAARLLMALTAQTPDELSERRNPTDAVALRAVASSLTWRPNVDEKFDMKQASQVPRNVPDKSPSQAVIVAVALRGEGFAIIGRVTLDTCTDLFDTDLDAVAASLHAAYSQPVADPSTLSRQGALPADEPSAISLSAES